VERDGDGYIATSGKDPQLYLDLLASLKEGADAAGRNVDQIDKFIEIKISYDKDVDHAKEACNFWAPLALKPEEKPGIDDATEMEAAADKILDRAHTRLIVSGDPDEVVEKIVAYVEVGLTIWSSTVPATIRRRFLRQFCGEVLPKLHERFGSGVSTGTGATAR
jgi:coenzyme F420-dependent glucose-6-phosphate dehydrogenase